MLPTFARTLAIILIGLVPAAALAQTSAPEPIKVTIASPSTDDVTPALYAQSAGIFKKYGLDVTITHMPSGAAIIAAESGGSVDIGAVSLLGLIGAHVHGVPVRIVAAAGLYDSDNQALLIARKGLTITSGKDMNGLTIGSPAIKDLNATATMAWIDQHGGDSSTIHVVEIPASAILPALQTSRVDAATVQVPSLTTALDSGDVHVVGKSWSAIAPRFHDSGWVATNDWIAKNPDTLRRFVLALREAATYTNVHHTETLPLISAFTGLDPAMLARGARSNHPQYIDPTAVQPVIEFAAKYKLIDKPFDAAEIIDPISEPAPKK